MRSPRWWLPVGVARTSKPPAVFLAAEPLVAPLSAASVGASATPVALRFAARWNRRTTLTVDAPYSPSVLVLKPAWLSSVCNALTRAPWLPRRRVLLPTVLAAADEAVVLALTDVVSACANAGTNRKAAAAKARPTAKANWRNGNND